MMMGVAFPKFLGNATRSRKDADEENDRPETTKIDLDHELYWNEDFEKDSNGKWKKRDK